MTEAEVILAFVSHFGRDLIGNGGTLERANDKMNLICESYGLEEISIFSLSSIIRISAKGKDGEIYGYQTNIKPMGINVEKLNQLNALSNKVVSETPDPNTLEDLLKQAGELDWDYDGWMILAGFAFALCCISFMFGGTYKDAICVAISTVIMFVVMQFLNSPGITSMIKNAVLMCIAGILGKLYIRLGIGDNLFTILLTNAFMLIPGIPLVNSIRNLLRGNEMNGIIELIKVILETFAIVIGVFLSVELLGGLL